MAYTGTITDKGAIGAAGTSSGALASVSRTANQTLIAFVVARASTGATATSISDSLGGGWIKIGDFQGPETNAFMVMGVYFLPRGAADTRSITGSATLSGSTFTTGVHVMALTDLYEDQLTNFTFNASSTTPNTTTLAGAAILTANTRQTQSAIGLPTGYTAVSANKVFNTSLGVRAAYDLSSPGNQNWTTGNNNITFAIELFDAPPPYVYSPQSDATLVAGTDGSGTGYMSDVFGGSYGSLSSNPLAGFPILGLLHSPTDASFVVYSQADSSALDGLYLKIGDSFYPLTFAASFSFLEIYAAPDGGGAFVNGQTYSVNIVDAAGGGSGQTLTPGLLTNSQTFFAPTVSRGAVNLSPPLLTNSSSFFAASIASTYTLAPPLLSDGDTFFAPIVSTATALSAPLLPSANAFFAPTVQPGAISLQPPLITNGQTFHAPAVASSVTLAPPLLVNSQSFPPPLVTTGQHVLAPPLIGSGTTIFPPVVSQGTVNLSPPLIGSSTSFFAAAITTTRTISAPLLVNGQNFPAATVTTMTTLSAPRIESGNVFFGGAIATGVVTLSPPRIPSGTLFPGATVSPGPVSLAPPLIESANAFFAAALTSEIQLAPPLLANDNEFFPPVVDNGEAPPFVIVPGRHAVAIAQTRAAAASPQVRHASAAAPLSRATGVASQSRHARVAPQTRTAS